MTMEVPPPRAELAYASIRNAILSREVDSGGWLRQQLLAKELGVSQSTVREALQRLVLEGLAVRIPYKGVKAVQLSTEALTDLYETRALLEGFAGELAARSLSAEELGVLRRLLPQTAETIDPASTENALSANRSFHQTIIGASGREHLIRLLRQLWESIEPYVRVAYGQSWSLGRAWEKRLGKTQLDYQEHTALLEALEQHDGGRAREIAIAHVSRECRDIATLVAARSCQEYHIVPEATGGCHNERPHRVGSAFQVPRMTSLNTTLRGGQ
jgi:DNA-binding GntR family transcriptional regulator